MAVRPNCSRSVSRFQSDHISPIFSRSRRKMLVPDTWAERFVAAMPRNGSRCVPVQVQWITTSLRSARISSQLNRRSGNPFRIIAICFFRLFRPGSNDGNTGSCKRQSTVTMSFRTSSLPWEYTSSKSFRAIALF